VDEKDEGAIAFGCRAGFEDVEGEVGGWAVDVVLGYALWEGEGWEVLGFRHVGALMLASCASG